VPYEPRAQQAQKPSVVRAIEPSAVALPPESATRGITRFSFIAYGDTRGPADGKIIQPMHRDVVNDMLDAIGTERRLGFPVGFIVQCGDAVANGRDANQWNVSFTPLVERLLRDGRVPYFFAVGNHDVGGTPVGDPDRQVGLTNVTAAMAKLWPPEGSPKRLAGYPTFAFGYGPMFVVALDSNVAGDMTQFQWVSDQLDRLDRRRFPLVAAIFHHPPITSGSHGGPVVERESETMRRLYLPLFRKHHVRMTIAGHDHLYDHYIEHYEDESGIHRLDELVTGGGGAPIYRYRGEPDLARYAASAAQSVTIEHPIRPGSIEADNPHHFVILEVDGDRIWLKLVATVARPFQPYGQERVELADRDN